jgi:dihydrofolate reductase
MALTDSTVSKMPHGITIVGHAIVSADGMIATADGSIPPSLIVDADQAAFQKSLDESALVVLGRKGHKRHPNPGRKRLVLTGSVNDLEQDCEDENATYWNPAGLDFAQVLQALGIGQGRVAVTGGQSVFENFLAHYTDFVLSEAHLVTVPKGLSCFSAGHPRQMLPRHGLLPRAQRAFVDNHAVTETHWRKI